MLIKKQALSLAAKKLGLFISDRQLQSMITQLPVFQVEGHFSPNRFQEILSRMLYTENTFFSETRNSLLLTQLTLQESNLSSVIGGQLHLLFIIFIY